MIIPSLPPPKKQQSQMVVMTAPEHEWTLMSLNHTLQNS
jgi:hypothetical protein